MGPMEAEVTPFLFWVGKLWQVIAKNSLDKADGYDMIKLSKLVELVPAGWAISICGDWRRFSGSRGRGHLYQGETNLRHFHFKGERR
jgi:hypothetical protein